MEKVEINKEKLAKDTIQGTKNFFDEFKVFISRGNVMDLAIGVVIGGAFSTIVTSLVNDIIMPLVGMLIGGHDFSNLVLKVGDATLKYGSFIQNVINFLIIAFCIFLVTKTLNKAFSKLDKKKKEEEKKDDVKEDRQLELLESILEELKKKNKK
jgi:large conductance mechanosensitive channel